MEGTQVDISNAAAAAAAAVVNCKRSRRPSVRLGEIGEIPVALFLGNKQPRKKRRATAPAPVSPPPPPPPPAPPVAPPAAAAAASEEEDEDVERELGLEEEDDPCAVDMSGFTSAESWQQKTKPLEEVAATSAAAAAEEMSDEGALLENGGVEKNVDEPEPEFVEEEKGLDEPEADRVEKVEKAEKASSLKRERKKRGGKKGKRKVQKAGAGSGRSWRVRKVVNPLTLMKDGVEEEEEHDEQQQDEQEEDQRQESEKAELMLVVATTDGDVSPEKNILEEIERDVENEERERIEQEQQNKQRDEQQQQQQQQQRRGDREETFVLPRSVGSWLEERRLGRFRELFEYHEVDEEVLPLLTMEDLREMGIHTVGSRRKLFHAIQGLS